MKPSVFLLCVAAAGLSSACHRHNAGHADSIPEIDVALAVEDSVTIHKTYPGTLIAKREVDLVARVDGYLLTQNYTPGDYVREGTVLFTIEDRNYRDAVAQAAASLSTAEASYKYNSERYEAMKRALESDAVSKIEVAQAKSAAEEAEASIKTAQAALQTARTSLSYCTVRAPFDGHVTTATHDIGSYLAGEGSPVPLAKIYHDKVMYVDFAIEDANYLSTLRNSVEAHPHAYDSIPVSFSEPLSKAYTARLDYMAPLIDTSTGTMKVQGMIDNPDGELRSGMYATVELPQGTEPHAVLIRDAAISTDQLGKYIYVVNDSDKVVYTPVTAGSLVDDSMRVISKGIAPGQKYVTKAMLKVRDGMEVKPIVK